MVMETANLVTIVDAVIAFTLLECSALAIWHARTGGGVAPREFVVNMVSGLCLMLALRAHVADAGSLWVLLGLLAAGTAHGIDLLLRWQRSPRHINAEVAA